MSILTADQLLDRMLKFANSPECPPDRKREVENGAWKTWADSITNINPYPYNSVKNEAVRYFNGSPLLPSRDANLNKYKRVCQIDKTTLEIVETFRTIIEAESKFGISNNAILNCLKGRTSSSAGYFWEIREFDN